MTDELDFDLTDLARTLDVPTGDVEAVVARAGQRGRRRHRALAGMTAVAVALTATGIYWTTNGDRGDETQLATEAGLQVRRGDAHIDWERLDTQHGIGFSTTVDGRGPIYALSTAAGQRDVNTPANRVVWRSSDGVEWTAVSTLDDTLYVSDLADVGDRIYAVGTGPASASVGGRRGTPPLLVGWSDDGAETWQHQSLPIDVQSLAANTTRVSVFGSQIASGAKGTIAIVSLDAELDVAKLLPAGQSAPHGWAITPAGIDILGDGPGCPAGTTRAKDRGQDANPQQPERVWPEPCTAPDGSMTEVQPQESRGVVASYTWDQLGVDGDLLLAVKRTPIMFTAPPKSTTFERVQLPALDPIVGVTQILADDTGFHAVTQTLADGLNQEPKPIVLESADGRTWTSAPGPSEVMWVSALGRLGGRLAMLGDGAQGPTIAVADGAGGWTASTIAEAGDNESIGLIASGVGDLGVVAVVATTPDVLAEAGGISVKSGDYTLRMPTSRDDAFVFDASGREIARTQSVYSGAGAGFSVEPNGSIVVLDPATNTPLARFESEDIDAARSEVFDKARPDIQPEFHVLASRDGLTWEEHAMSELAGTKVTNVVRVTVTGDRAVVAFTLPGTGVPSRQAALVATPE